ncbi:MAG TPA: DUF4082 domain-containing protein [Mycobacteriales bacterium]|nr:DUF4082 domain-containing protein [Mycobacteriales bacterium]
MSRPRHYLPRVLALVAVLLTVTGVMMLPATSAFAAGPCTAPVTNKVACENTLPGTPETQWRVGGNDDTIVGYTTDISVNAGSQVGFKIQTDAHSYKIDIYRLGWYGGDGARLVATVNPSVALPQSQPSCLSNSTGLVDCGNWKVSATWNVPSTAVSGLYYAVPHRNDTGGENEIFFVVRDDASQAAMYFQTSDPTWQAYNVYGGNSFYTGTGPGPDGSAWKVSYNRPLQGGGQENMPFNAEVPMLRFLEANGYDVTYGSGLDTDRLGSTPLKNHKIFLSVGHDEYWSGGQRANVEAAKAAGVNLAFFSANEVFWKTRWEPTIDTAGTANRTLVCYKETKWSSKIDPSPQWTGTWRDPRFSPPSDGGRPENALIGQQFIVNGYRKDALQVPAAYGKMRLWRSTALASMAAGSTYTFADGTLGYEWDTLFDNGSQPAGVAKLSQTTVSMTDGPYVLQNYGDQYAPGTATHWLTLYRDPVGHGLVFGSGTVQWPWGLDDYHSFDDDGSTTSDVRIKQATVNLFADMGVSASTLQSGLVQTSASTDTTAPVVTINTPSSPVVGSPLTLSGSVTDAGGQVADVEVSVDGGTTWHYATWQAGSGSWSYVYTPGQSGTVDVRARAVDDSTNLSTPVSKSITVAPRACPCSIWPSAATPGTPSANDSSALELGVKFRSQVAGWLSGVKFYKGTGNTGTHSGSLWSTSGQLLATGTFTNETATGWQTLTFGTPVQVTANTTYVASYHTNTGHYAADSGGLAQQYFNEPLTALANGADGPNGVYRLGASGYPSDTYNSANYWVDVVFGTVKPPDTQPPVVATTSPANNVSGVQLSATPSATFNEPVRTAGLTFTLAAGAQNVSGSVVLDATGTVATFTPAADLAGGTSYTATVRAYDVAGNQMAASYSWTFKTGTPRPAGCPCTIWDDFSQPVEQNTNDPSTIELGTKVRFDTNGYVLGVRFFKGAQNTGTHTGTLWSAAGTQLATGTFSGESASGWQTLTFASPVHISGNTTYVVSYHTNVGFYSSSGGYFSNGGADYGALHALRDGVDGGNGVYRYGASGFPTGTYNSGNYWVDVVWTNSLSGDNTPPVVTATTPTDGATNVSNTSTVTATFNEALDPTSIQFTLVDGGGATIDSTVSYNATTKTATLTPKAKLSAGETYTARVLAADADDNLMTSPKLVVFTTTTTQTCPCTIFSTATLPSVASAADGGSYQLGVRFTADTGGQVTAVKFYKGPNNTGTHTGSLWTGDGQLLATGTFSNETATGWQTLTFAAPVPIVAGTVYVASYTAPSGGYAADVGYFQNGEATSVPLHAPATGGSSINGVFTVGTGFPGDTYRGTNYWVDVVVAPAPPGGAAAPTGAQSLRQLPATRPQPTQPLAVLDQPKSRRLIRRPRVRLRG